MKHRGTYRCVLFCSGCDEEHVWLEHRIRDEAPPRARCPTCGERRRVKRTFQQVMNRPDRIVRGHSWSTYPGRPPAFDSEEVGEESE